jgi:hypothetical protein
MGQKPPMTATFQAVEDGVENIAQGRKEWVRGLPSAFGVGRNDRKRVHSASERSVGYVFLIEESVQNYPNPHPYQTGS